MSTRRKSVVAILVVIFAMAGGLFVSLGVMADWRAFTVQGGSMQPLYGTGDLIVTSTSDAGSVKPGQIIVFTADWASEKYEHRVVHRVAAVGTIGDVPVAYTRGDANSVDDPLPVELTGGVRVVRFSIQANGFLLNLLDGPFTLAFMVATLGAVATGAFLIAGPRLLDLAVLPFRRREPVRIHVPLPPELRTATPTIS